MSQVSSRCTSTAINRKAVKSELSCSFKLTFNRDIAFFHAFFHPSILIFGNLTLI